MKINDIMLTDKEKKIISLIAQDSESGRNLLRTDDEWKFIGCSIKEYSDCLCEMFCFATELDSSGFWLSLNDILEHEDDEKIHLLSMLIYFASCKSHKFNEFLKGFNEKN